MPVYDGVNLRVTLDAPTLGVLNLDIREVIYEGWKDWLLENGARLGFPPLFRPVGGDPLPGSLTAGSYYFIRNDLGWRIISSDEDQTINYIGNIVPEDPTKQIIVPTPGRTVLHLGIQPITQGTSELLAAAQLGLTVSQFLALKGV